MNTLWTIPTAIEIAILAICLVIARSGLRLRLRSATAALLLMCPVPLAYVVAGGNSALFMSDAVGVFCLFWLAMPRNRNQSLFADKTARLPVMLAALLLVVLPSVSTALGVAATGKGDWKLIAVGLFRGCAYLGLFCAAIHFGKRGEEVDKLIAIQCIAFALICCCGILQAYTGLDLTLPSPTTSVLQGDLAADSSSGFMGLYRGAIGGWGAVVLGVIPLVLFRRRYGWVIAPACMLAVLTGIILAGSRQGLFIGLIAALLGTLGALANGRGKRPGSVRALVAVAVLALGGLCLYSTTASTSYDSWINYRFGSLFGLTTVGDQVAGRDDRMAYAIDRWLTNSMMVQVLGAGRGRLSDGITTYPGEVGYVDSEVVWQLQENGLAALLAYGFFLVTLARRLRLYEPSTDSSRSTVRAAKVGLVSGILLIYGHFFLLHVQYSQAPVAYWNWALLGVAIGTVIRAKRPGPPAVAARVANSPLQARFQGRAPLPQA